MRVEGEHTSLLPDPPILRRGNDGSSCSVDLSSAPQGFPHILNPVWVGHTVLLEATSSTKHLKHLKKQTEPWQPRRRPEQHRPSSKSGAHHTQLQSPQQTQEDRRRMLKTAGGAVRKPADSGGESTGPVPTPGPRGALTTSPQPSRERATCTRTPASPAPPTHRLSSSQFLFCFSN